MTNSIVKLAAVGLISLSLSACFHDNDDDDKPKANTPPTTVSVDLITQADTPIVDRVTATDALVL